MQVCVFDCLTALRRKQSKDFDQALIYFTYLLRSLKQLPYYSKATVEHEKKLQGVGVYVFVHGDHHGCSILTYKTMH